MCIMLVRPGLAEGNKGSEFSDYFQEYQVQKGPVTLTSI